MSDKTWTIRRDQWGAATAIELDGRTILHLLAGTERNESDGGAEMVLALLQATEKLSTNAEITRLQAIVGKLPTDAHGNPVTPADRLFHRDYLTGNGIHAWLFWEDGDTGGYATSLDDSFSALVCECHITREAAEAEAARADLG